MVLHVYNTLTKQKEEFNPLKGKKVNMFVCGVTVYNYTHIGHAKTYVQFDIIAKYLRYKKYNVFYLQNITDIDDKIIKKAIEENKNWKEISKFYEKSYLEDILRLKVSSVNKYARATDYIPQIVSQVQRLIKKGNAYKTSDGYYFDLSTFKDYGKLAGRTELSQDDSISRIDDNNEKRNKGDFCLWKFSKTGEPSWNAVIGTGRPGWHIEDTAITEKEFGAQYDLHGGGSDLIFPHHEAEITQMESVSGKVPFVKYWLHTGFVNVNQSKMSKSLGNFFLIKEALEKYDPLILRYLFVSSHYRKPIEFTPEILEQAKNSLQRIHDFVLTLENYSKGKANKIIPSLLKKTQQAFEEAMDDDFETGRALNAVFELVREVNSFMGENNLSKTQANQVLKLLKKLDNILGILEEKQPIPEEVQQLAHKRQEARKNKNWQEADRIREELKKLGYTVDDTSTGIILKKL